MKKIYALFCFCLLWLCLSINGEAAMAMEVGEFCETAEAPVLGANQLPATTLGEYWYSYTMPQAGKLTISSGVGDYLEVYSNSCANLNYKGYGSGNAGVAGLAEGEEVFIRWYPSNGGDFSWNLAVEDNAEGDMCSMAAVAVLGANAVPATIGEYWYSYPMPQDGKLIISSELGEDISVYSNSCDNLNYEGGGWSGTSVAGFTAGEDIFIRWRVRNGGDFSWNLTVEDNAEGDMCSMAAVAALGANAVPATMGEYWYSYTMPQDGKLVISSELGEDITVYSNSCENLSHKGNGWTNLTVPGLSGGEEVFLRWYTYNGGDFNWNLAVEDNVVGDYCGLPVAATDVNEVPVTSNNYYWYSYTIPQEGKLSISSDVSKYVTVFGNNCDNLYYKGEGNGNVSVTGLTAGEEVYIRWSTYNGGEFSWNLAVEDYAEGDLCSLAAAATLGANAVTATSGEYWFSYTMPQDGKLSISTEASEAVEIYSNTCESLNYVGDGWGNASVTGLVADEQVYIRWRIYNGGDFSWNLAVEDYAEGDLCSLAAAATLGANAVTATSGEYWYSYTMPQDGKLSISSGASESVEIYSNTCESLNYVGDGWGNASVTGLVADEQVYIRWRIYNGGNFSWNLAVEDYAEGDLCSLAAAAVLGANELPATTGDYWYSFIMPQEGKLSISTGASESVEIYSNTCEELVYHGDGWGNASVTGLVADEQVYIRWRIYNGGNFSWDLAVEDYVEGDMCSLPVVAGEGTNTSPYAPYWFTFTMPADGDLTISSMGTATNDTYLRLFETCEGSQVAYNDDFGGTLQSEVTLLNRIQGEVLYIKWDDNYSSGGFDWTIKVETPEGVIQTISFDPIEDLPLSTGSIMLNATASSGLAVSYEVTAGSATLSGSTLSFTAAGSVTVVASQAGDADYAAAEPVSQSFCVNPDQPTISIENGGAADVGAILVSSSASGNQWYNNGVEIAGAVAQTYETSTNGLYTARVISGTCTSDASNSIQIGKIDQTISFSSISDQLLSAGSVVLDATASSGLAVTYEVTAGSASLSGSTLSFTAAGSVTVVASQAGDDAYEAAEPVSVSFCVNPDKPTVSMEAGADAVVGATLESSSATGNQWFKDDVLIDGATADTYITTEAGLYTVQVSAGSCMSAMSDGLQVNEEEVVKENQTISFTAIDDQPLSAGSVVLEATASSGLAVSYEVTAGTASLSGSTLSFTAAGSVTVVASQAGDDAYETATPVSRSFCVNPDKPTVGVEAGSDAVVGAALASSSATGNQWFKDGVQIDGATADTYVTTKAGLYTVQVSAGSCMSAMSDGLQVDEEEVVKENQTISFTAIDDQPLSAGSIVLEATASSGLAVSYEVTAGSATISGNELVFDGPGSVTVVASQAGDDAYEAAEPVSVSFCVNPDKPTVSMEAGADAVVGVTLESSSATGNQWFKDGVLIDGATADTYVTTEAGSYTVQVSAGSCMSVMSDGLEIEAEVTGIADSLDENLLSLFPNPTVDVVNMELAHAKSGGRISVSIVDLKGSKVKVISSVTVQANGKSLVQVDLSGLEAGLYYILINDGERLSKAKVHKM